MKNISIHLLLLVLLLVCWSCEEIFDKDIEGKKVILFSPSNNTVITANTVMFKWTELEGAKQYRLIVVNPTFSAVTEVLADTLLTKNEFSLNLKKGSYQWTVSAINNTAVAYADTFSVEVLQSTDLSSTIITNLYPKNALSSTGLTFTWDPVYSANTYVFTLWTPAWEDGVRVKLDTVSTPEYTISNIDEGTYYWGVKALNDTTQTEYSQAPLVIDRTPPGQPTLISPTEASTNSTSSITFQWTRVSDAGSTLSDSLIIASDSQFTNIVVKKSLSLTTSIETIATAGTYYWKVKTIDAAGNKSQYSATRTFIRQ